MRTGGYGAVRAATGRLVSGCKINHAADAREPAGDNGAGIALLRFADTRVLAYLPGILHASEWERMCGAVGC